MYVAFEKSQVPVLFLRDTRDQQELQVSQELQGFKYVSISFLEFEHLRQTLPSLSQYLLFSIESWGVENEEGSRGVMKSGVALGWIALKFTGLCGL